MKTNLGFQVDLKATITVRRGLSAKIKVDLEKRT